MRNRNKINQLGRTASHRNALMMNLANALITHKRITTTVPKAKALRGYVEPLITKSKSDTTHSRRAVFRHLQDKEVVTELFREVGPKVADRPGGYTRIIKTGFRAGDSAEMCMIELVDFNEIYVTEAKAATKKTRRSRRGSGGGAAKTTEAAAPVAEEVVEEATVEEVVEETNATEEVAAESPAAESPAAEEAVEKAAESAETTEEVTETPEAPEAEESKEEEASDDDKKDASN